MAETKIISGRVISLDRGYPLIKTKEGEVRAQHSIDLVKNSRLRSVVGDIVDVEFPQSQDTPLIVRIQPRKHTLYRRAMIQSRSVGSGKYEEKILATNIDIVFVVSSLSTKPIDLSYLERQLVMAHESEAEVAVVLSKADQAKNLDADLRAVKDCATGCEVIAESAVTRQGIEQIRELIAHNRFGVLLGRSGVGKSSLINALAKKPLLETAAVREKDKAGRHTTVGRKMIFFKDSAIIDTPGLRSVGLYDAQKGLEATFAEIQALATRCHYRDCSHTNEPGCAVLQATESGVLSPRRLASFTEIAKEVKGLN